MEETIMRGRYPSGPEYVDVQHLHGSAQAKERLRVILETMMGQWRVAEACDRLGICERSFPPSNKTCPYDRCEAASRRRKRGSPGQSRAA
jgi:hypothetical protein